MNCSLLYSFPTPAVAVSPVSGLAVTEEHLSPSLAREARRDGPARQLLAQVLLGDVSSPIVRATSSRCLDTGLEVHTMVRVTPLSARVIVAVSDAEMRARKLFLDDAELSAEEQSVLTSLREASELAQAYDFARRAGDWIRDTGEIPEGIELSPWLERERHLLDAITEVGPGEGADAEMPRIGVPVWVPVTPGIVQVVMVTVTPEETDAKAA